MSNTKDIVNGYRKHLHKTNEIKQIHEKIKILYDKMLNDIKDITDIYTIILKNIHPDKKEICNITNFNSNEYSNYYIKDNTLRKLFLNKDGFSLSNSFNKINEPTLDVSRTSYVHQFYNKGFMKFLKRILEKKNEIINVIEKEYKKSIAIRFFEALEKSDCDKVFDYEQDFDYLKEDKNLEIEYYKENEIVIIKINFFQYKNASNSIIISKEGYRRDEINLDDLEKCSQIFDEMMEFLKRYYNHLEIQDESLLKFNILLKDAFARELIVNSLKEKKK